MKKWRLFAILGYFSPIILVIFIKFFTKWGQDVENCIFTFFVGIVLEGIFGVLGLIHNCRKGSFTEVIFLLFNLLPLILVVMLFVFSKLFS